MLSRIRNRLRARWQDLLDGFWFIPGLIALVGPLLALLVLWLDSTGHTATEILTFGGNASEARTLLSIVVSALITVTGIILPITLVTLQLVSSQFTPRALRALLSDRITHTTFGGLLGIFIYCTIILISLRDPSEGGESGFLPRQGIEIAIMMIFLTVLLLGIFISHTVSAIQVSHIASRLAHQTFASIEHPYLPPQKAESEDNSTELMQVWSKEREPIRIFAPDAGYIQTIDLHHLIQIVKKHHVRMHVKVCPGDFVTQGTAIIELWPPSARVHEEIVALRELFALARERDLAQDAAFGIRQLADICLRALSPAINDPSTAILCIGYLRALLERITSTPDPKSVYHFAEDTILITRYHTFKEYISVFSEIGTYAADNVRVVSTLLDSIISIASHTYSLLQRERFPLLYSISQKIAQHVLQQGPAQYDQDEIRMQMKHIEHITKTTEIPDHK